MDNSQSYTPRKKVLFLCTGNSCRSQMAEAVTNNFLKKTWSAVSAGTDPAEYIHPLAVRVLQEIGIIHQGEPKSPDAFLHDDFDLIVTVCDHARESCPLWFGKGKIVHAGFPDPARIEGTEEEVITAFRNIRDGIVDRIPSLLKQYQELEENGEY